MPLYEYECTTCHKHTEKIQKFSDPEITVCPHCGGQLERVISAPAVSFKGGGWYADGYGNAKPKSSSDSNSTSNGDSKSSTDSKPTKESAPAAAPATAAPAAASASSSPDKK
ncbi:MAG TPA: zinc ribbon domain-containing protein [Edaphobacter sp.]|jgi:putative FmdB family regulatory protein|nr:zinc ribbon domain-containing protein [Edaphobacter sp.]